MKNKLTKFICAVVMLIMSIGVLCACNKDNNFRNERNGEPEAGAFYSLQTAYDNGWICRNDLRNIAYHRTGDAQKKGFVPTPKNPEVLSAETELAIKEAYFERYCSDNKNLIVEQFEIEAYYGIYGDLVAVKITGNVYPECIYEETIGGVKFVYSDTNTILLWKQ